VQSCIETIDEFQGQEAEVTIVSMVRSNVHSDLEKAMGFVNIPRLCVAISKSKRKTIIAGDQNTLIKSKFDRNYNKKRWFFYMEKLSGHRIMQVEWVYAAAAQIAGNANSEIGDNMAEKPWHLKREVAFL